MLAGYYLATPLFALLDVVWGVNIRVMALDDFPALKYGYYALCLGFGALAAARPALAGIVATTESSVNLGLVVMTIPLAYLGVLQGMLDGHDAANPFTREFFANFALSATVALTGYFRSQGALAATRR